MRNIPVDTEALSFVCVAPPRPKLVDQDTGEVKVDKQGRTVYTVGLTAADQSGRVELINVSVAGECDAALGQVVQVSDLIAFPWEQVRNGALRWGIAYRAARISAAPTPGAAA